VLAMLAASYLAIRVTFLIIKLFTALAACMTVLVVAFVVLVGWLSR
jgi:hypothetical protein